MTMRRDDALRALAPQVRDDDIIVAVYQTNFDWMALNPRPLNYVSVGAMGQASSHGLGLALANPDRRVIVLDGDGSLLMNLGSLVTSAHANLANFWHMVFVNRTYEVNGALPVPGGDKFDFAQIAKGAGYTRTARYGDLAGFTAGLAGFLKQPGPAFAHLDIIPGEAHPRDYAYIHSRRARDSFTAALVSARQG